MPSKQDSSLTAEKERAALVRMLIYIHYELTRNNFNEEAGMISAAMASLEAKAKADNKEGS